MDQRQWSGRVEHRFNLNHSIPTTTSNDRAAKELRTGSPPRTPKAGNKRSRSHSPSGESTKYQQLTKQETGFFFIPDLDLEGRNLTANQREYRVVAPYETLKDIIDAARFDLSIIITKFNVIPNQSGDFIELHRNGTILQGKRKAEGCEFMSLEDFHAIEKQLEKHGKKTSAFNIKGTIDSISPIISAIPSDPFAMIELYDHTCPSLTAVVVLKGTNALLCHPGIRPGSRVNLKNIRRQRWYVPQSLQNECTPKRLHARCPSHVFVISESNCIEWEDCVDPCVDRKDGAAILLPLPSTVCSLTSIEGSILAVRYTTFSISTRQNTDCNISPRIIHYIILEPSSGKGIVKLYMTYYPLSPTCALGIRKGSRIQAMNIHEIKSNMSSSNLSSYQDSEYECFGACLRSTVSIISTASENLRGSGSDTNEHANNSNFASYAFKHVKQSYHELEWMSQCRKQLSACNNADKRVMERALRKLIVDVIGDDFVAKGRDPYKEFFDHACEPFYNDDEEKSSSFCPCDTFLRSRLPLVLGLSTLRQECILLMRTEIPQSCHLFSDQNDITNRAREGCTAAIHFTREEFIGKLGLPSATLLCVGGLVEGLSRSGTISSIIDNGHHLTVFPCLEKVKHCHHDTKTLYEKGDFVIVNVHKIIMSIIYLGRYPRRPDELQIPIEITDLPGIDSNLYTQLKGPSTILTIGCHHFIVSIQIAYAANGISSLNGRSTAEKDSDHDFVQESKKTVGGKDNIKTHGRLLRQRWRIRKDIKAYTGCQFTVGTTTSSLDSGPFHLPQTLNVNIGFPLVTCNHGLIRHVCQGISDRILSMASAWQYTAETISSPLVSGGWDDLCSSDWNHAKSEIYVILPHYSNGNDIIEIGSIEFQFIEQQCSIEHLEQFKTCCDTGNGLTHLGGRKVSPGNIDRRLKRSIIYQEENREVTGEATIVPSLILGVADVSIATLASIKPPHRFEALFVKNAFKIKGANIAKVRFCRARAECSRCNSPLNCRADSIKKKSFWNDPLPINATNAPTSKLPMKRKTNLTCPNQCDEAYGYIKWELSGVLQDSTGCTRVYSEREISLMILGSGLDIDVVEEGAWYSAYGINYQIGLPLSKEMKVEIETAKRNARSSRANSFEAKLSRETRARYTLYLHCKASTEPYRRMDFLSRCKPLKKDAYSVKPFEIPLVSSLGDGQGVSQRNDMSTSRMGTELRILDCYRSYDESKETGWSIINALN
jgi:hypothetical protein